MRSAQQSEHDTCRKPQRATCAKRDAGTQRISNDGHRRQPMRRTSHRASCGRFVDKRGRRRGYYSAIRHASSGRERYEYASEFGSSTAWTDPSTFAWQGAPSLTSNECVSERDHQNACALLLQARIDADVVHALRSTAPHWPPNASRQVAVLAERSSTADQVLEFPNLPKRCHGGTQTGRSHCCPDGGTHGRQRGASDIPSSGSTTCVKFLEDGTAIAASCQAGSWQ